MLHHTKHVNLSPSLHDLASGEMVGAYALTEPEHGSDSLGAKATAVLSEDGKYYILNGQKQFISNAGFADLFLTYAQIDGIQFTSFIIERQWDGVSVDEEEEKMGVIIQNWWAIDLVIIFIRPYPGWPSPIITIPLRK